MDKERLKISLGVISGRVNLPVKLAKEVLCIEKEYPTKEDILFEAEKIIFEEIIKIDEIKNGLAV